MLERENAGNVIGLFIEKMKPAEDGRSASDEGRNAQIRQKALYYGTMALMGREL